MTSVTTPDATPKRTVTGIEVKDDPGSSAPPMTPEEKIEFARDFIRDANDLASFKSEISLRFHVLASCDEEGMKHGLVITSELIDKMRKGALKALDPDVDLDGNNIVEIKTAGYAFKQLMNGHKAKAELRRLLPEYKPPAPKSRLRTSRTDPRKPKKRGAGR